MTRFHVTVAVTGDTPTDQLEQTLDRVLAPFDRNPDGDDAAPNPDGTWDYWNPARVWRLRDTAVPDTTLPQQWRLYEDPRRVACARATDLDIDALGAMYATLGLDGTWTHNPETNPHTWNTHYQRWLHTLPPHTWLIAIECHN
ncbi:hypothetical protein ACWDUL_33620 [Nocardia niigatensis]